MLHIRTNYSTKTVITSPAFTGSEKGGRRYSPFTTNVERLILGER